MNQQLLFLFFIFFVVFGLATSTTLRINGDVTIDSVTTKGVTIQVEPDHTLTIGGTTVSKTKVVDIVPIKEDGPTETYQLKLQGAKVATITFPDSDIPKIATLLTNTKFEEAQSNADKIEAKLKTEPGFLRAVPIPGEFNPTTLEITSYQVLVALDIKVPHAETTATKAEGLGAVVVFETPIVINPNNIDDDPVTKTKTKTKTDEEALNPTQKDAGQDDPHRFLSSHTHSKNKLGRFYDRLGAKDDTDPLVGGANINVVGVSSGTLGGFFSRYGYGYGYGPTRNRYELYAITNSHVLPSAVGTDVCQPSIKGWTLLNPSCGSNCCQVMGKILSTKLAVGTKPPTTPRYVMEIDLAAAKVDLAKRTKVKCAIQGIGPVDGVSNKAFYMQTYSGSTTDLRHHKAIYDPPLGLMKVKKFGARTHLTEGIILEYYPESREGHFRITGFRTSTNPRGLPLSGGNVPHEPDFWNDWKRQFVYDFRQMFGTLADDFDTSAREAVYDKLATANRIGCMFSFGGDSGSFILETDDKGKNKIVGQMHSGTWLVATSDLHFKTICPCVDATPCVLGGVVKHNDKNGVEKTFYGVADVTNAVSIRYVEDQLNKILLDEEITAAKVGLSGTPADNAEKMTKAFFTPLKVCVEEDRQQISGGEYCKYIKEECFPTETCEKNPAAIESKRETFCLLKA